jgi:glutamyl-tRNA synthetase
MLHVGNARTALFDWLFARGHGGTSLLRIEDTDESRNHPEWVDVIYRSLEWLGLDWDESPKFQSAAFEAHRETAEKLHADGFAYYCDCTKDDVERRNAAAGQKTPGYDSHCRDRGLGPGEGRALRFRVPDDGTLLRRDVIRGETAIDLSTVEDFAIVRSNGMPLYVLANALDDIADGITHVLRGEDHLANVPKQILIRQALGHGEPVWAHLPMIVNEQRKKLSKRRDKVALDSFRVDGYLPEAMVNYLATLGWAPPSESGDEIASVSAMVAAFRLEDVNSSPAAFDERKLAAFNGHYLRELPVAEFVARARPFFGGDDGERGDVLERMAAHVQTRIERLSELPSMLDFLVEESPTIDEASWDKAMKDADRAQSILTDALGVYGAPALSWVASALHDGLAAVAERQGLGLAKAQAPVRVAVTGRTVGPPLFESLEVLGRDATLLRLRAALDRLGPGSASASASGSGGSQ